MRTPWRFVVDLVSRKPKEALFDDARSTAGKIKALEHQPANEEQMLDSLSNAPAPSEEVERESETRSTSLRPEDRPEISPASGEIHHSPDKVDQPAAGEEKGAFHAPVAETALAARLPERRPGKKPEPVIGLTAAFIDAAAAPIVTKTFVQEMAEVDAEVDGLRRELIKKLTEQNAQLRKMLARFETY